MTRVEPPVDVALLGAGDAPMAAYLTALEGHPQLRLSATFPPADRSSSGEPWSPVVGPEAFAAVRGSAAVVVSGPADGGLLSELAQSGRHLLVAPEAIPTVADARRLLDLAAHAGGSLLPALAHRFGPEALTARALVDDRRLGQMVFARFALLDPGGPGSRTHAGHVEHATVAPEAAAAAVLDVARQWFAGMPTVAHAERGPEAATRTGYVVTSARFALGQAAICESQTSTPQLGAPYLELFLQGTTGMARFPTDASANTVIADGARPLMPTTASDAHRQLVADWAASVLGRGPSSVDGEDLIAFVGLREAIRWSLQHHRAAEVPAHLAGEEELG